MIHIVITSVLLLTIGSVYALDPRLVVAAASSPQSFEAPRPFSLWYSIEVDGQNYSVSVKQIPDERDSALVSVYLLVECGFPITICPVPICRREVVPVTECSDSSFAPNFIREQVERLRVENSIAIHNG